MIYNTEVKKDWFCSLQLKATTETMNSDAHYLKRHSELRQQLTNKDGSLASRLTQALADMLVMGRPSLTVILQNTQCLFFKQLKTKQKQM